MNSEGASYKMNFLFGKGGFHAKGIVLRFSKIVEATFLILVYFIFCLT